HVLSLPLVLLEEPTQQRTGLVRMLSVMLGAIAHLLLRRAEQVQRRVVFALWKLPQDDHPDGIRPAPAVVDARLDLRPFDLPRQALREAGADREQAKIRLGQ